MLPTLDPTPEPKKKLAVPHEAALKQVLAIIRGAYKEDSRAADKATLAKKLLRPTRARATYLPGLHCCMKR